MQRILIFRRPATAVAVALVASGAIAACGGSSSSGSAAASTTNTGLKFAACVRAHGVPDYPDPGSSNGGASGKTTPGRVTVDGHVLSESSQVVQAAMNKCQKLSPDSSFGPVYSAAQMAKVRVGALAMAKCMRGHGIDYPDPTVTPGPGGHGFEYGFSIAQLKSHRFAYKSPVYNAANKACSQLLDRAIVTKKG